MKLIEIVRDRNYLYCAKYRDEAGVINNTLGMAYTDYRTLKRMFFRETGLTLPKLSELKFYRGVISKKWTADVFI